MITKERLAQLFSYDPETGLFTRIIGRKGVAAGAIAGAKMFNGYIAIGIDHKQYLAHRLVWLWVHGQLPSKHIDHINGNREDNRISNLRLVDRVENMRNMKMPASNKSGVKGVCWHKAMKKWHVQIRHSGEQHSLGFFDDLAEAEKCIEAARAELHKEFARSR